MSQPSARLVYLSNYLRELLRDVAAQGKVAKIEGNPVQQAAVALLSGGIAMGEALVADLKVLAGGAAANVKTLARPMLQQAATQVVGGLFDRIFGGQKP